MTYISLQIISRHGSRTAFIIESWQDPHSGKKCTRTVRCCGRIEKGESKDPFFLDHLQAEVAALRRKVSVLAELRSADK